MNIKDEAVEAAKRIRDTAMQQTLAARIPESGHFGAIAQDADWLVDHLSPAPAGVTVADALSQLSGAIAREAKERERVNLVFDTLRVNIEKSEPTAEFAEALRDYWLKEGKPALASHEPAPENLPPVYPLVQPWETRPQGDDALEPSEIEIHEGSWAIVVGTNAKPAGWIDTHALFAHQVFLDRLAPRPAPEPAKDGPEVVAWVIPGLDNANSDGFIDALAWEEGEFSKPLVALSDYEELRAENERRIRSAISLDDEVK